MPQIQNKRVLYLGNLRSDLDDTCLTENIFNLFTQYLGIQISWEDIEIHGKYGKPCYSFINVHEEHIAEYALDRLETWQDRKSLGFRFGSICEVSSPLNVNYKLQKKKKKRKKQIKMKEYNSDVSDEDFEQSDPYFNHMHYHKMKNAILDQQLLSHDQEYYTEGEKLGNETRYTEFKTGGSKDLEKKELKEYVGKYVCAFLNGKEDGTLYIGVRDDGSVKGVPCSQEREDKFRLNIDEIIKRFRPDVFPEDYRVDFVPVLSSQDSYTQIISDDLKVIRIYTKAKPNSKRLYSSDLGVFIRRDGSIQGPLNAQQIQEWGEHRHEQEKIDFEEEKRNLQEKLQAQQDLLNDKIKSDMKLKKKKRDKNSKVCIVM